MMNPVSNNLAWWDVFLTCNAPKKTIYSRPTNDTLKLAIDMLSQMDQGVDQLSLLVRNSKNAQGFLKEIMYQVRAYVYSYSDVQLRPDLEKISKLYRSIVNNMNNPWYFLPLYDDEMRKESPVQQSPEKRILKELDEIVKNPALTKEKPTIEEINQLLNRFDAFMWKSYSVFKDKPAWSEVIKCAEDLLSKYINLSRRSEYLTQGVQLVTIILELTAIKIDMNFMLTLLKFSTDEIICKALLRNIRDFIARLTLEESYPILQWLHLNRDGVIGIIKIDAESREAVKKVLVMLFDRYTSLTFNAQNGRSLLSVFDLINCLREIPDLVTPQMIEAYDETASIQCEDGPLYIKKYQLLILSKYSPVIERHLFSDYCDSVEFSTKNTIVLKNITRKDFRLLLVKFYSNDFSLKEMIKLNLLSEYLDIKNVRMNTQLHFKSYIERLPKNIHGFYTDKSFAEIYELCSTLVECELISLIEGCIGAIRLPCFQKRGCLYDIWIASTALNELELYFRQYCLYYSLKKKYFPQQLSEINKNEVIPYIQYLVNLSPNDVVRYQTLLEFLTRALLTQPLEKKLQFVEENEFGEFAIVDKLDHSLKLDLSLHPIKLGVLEAVEGLFVSDLYLKKDNFSNRQLERIAIFFPGVVITFKE